MKKFAKMLSPLIRLLVIALFALGLVRSFTNPSAVLAQPPANDRLGICHVNLLALQASNEMLNERYRHALEAGAGWTRYEVRWDQIESQAGFDFSRQDEIVRRDVAAGLKIDAILNATPASYATAGFSWIPGPRVGQRTFTWAQMAGLSAATSAPANLFEPIFADGTDVPAPGKAVNPNNFWARFVHKTVTRYMPGGLLAQAEGWPAGAGIRVWEVWNEPDHIFWSGTVEEYYRLLKVAYLVVESLDPEAIVMLAGLAHWTDPQWFPDFLEVVAADPNPTMRDQYNQFFDAAAWHWYSNPRHLYEKTVEMRTLMQAYGLPKKVIWVNESGVPIWDEYPGPTWDPNSPLRATVEEQAAWVLQGFAEGFAAGVERIFFFQLYDDCGNGPDAWDAFGLIRNPVGTIGEKACAEHPDQPGIPRPAYKAYQVAADVFRSVQPTWRHHDYASGLGRVALFRPPDERVLVLWNWAFEDKTFTIIPTGDAGELIDMAGNRQTVVPANGGYRLTLPAATNDNWNQPGAMIGGKPLILIEKDTRVPTTAMEPLPASSEPSFEIAWDVQDWGTGLAAYQVWYSLDQEPATPEDWVLLQEESDIDPVQSRVKGRLGFEGQAGHTYYFAIRAQDRAGNWSPLREAQAWTQILDKGVISGQVADLRTQPIPSATVEVLLAGTPVATGTAQVEGRFVIPDVPLGQTYGVRAMAAGFGSWPPQWKVTPTSTATPGVTLYLPPVSNAVTNGGFEEGKLAGWTAAGQHPPIRSNFGLSGEDPEAPKAALLGFEKDQPAIGESVLSQRVQIPSEDPALGFWYRVLRTAGENPATLNRFEVRITALPNGASQVVYEDKLSASEVWQYRWVDLRGFAGQEVELAFRVIQPAANLQTVVYIDNVALGTVRSEPGRWRKVFLPLLSHR